jgi:malonate transporter and related proteins
MTALLSIIFPVFALIAVGYVAGRLKVFGDQGVGLLTQATFIVFMPPLLFRAMATVDLTHLSVAPVLAYFSTAIALMLGLAFVLRAQERDWIKAIIRAFTASFSNTVLLGIPIVQLAFGQRGLAILLTIVALHALILLTLATVLIEIQQSRATGSASVTRIALQTGRNALIHPVVLPIVLGLLWGLTGWHLPEPIDATLKLLGQAGPPASLVLLGASLVAYGVRKQWKVTLALTVIKLTVLPAAVFLVARWVFGISGEVLAVITLTAALPAGANAYLLAQRYHTAIGEACAAIALSTALGAVSLSLLLPWVAGL